MHNSKFLIISGVVGSETLRMGQNGLSRCPVLAQIGLGVRFRTGQGVFWHRSALVSDLARWIKPG